MSAIDKNMPRFQKPSGGSSAATLSPHLYVCGLGDSLQTPKSLIRKIFEPYGELDDELPWEGIDCPVGKRYVFISYKTLESAKSAYTDLSNGKCLEALNGGKLYLRYAERTREEDSRGPSVAECTSSTRDVHVPGLILVEDFISEDEEACFWDLLDSSPWEEGLSRRVQHYGVPFNYRTLMLDYNRKVEPIPKEFREVIQRMIDFASKKHTDSLMQTYVATTSPSSSKNKAEASALTNTNANANANANTNEGIIAERDSALPPLSLGQLTVNEYDPGQGIAAHIDTYNCFGPEIFILSMGSGVTMNMVRRSTSGETRAETSGGTEGKGGCEGEGKENDDSFGAVLDGDSRKALWLPRRSLLLLTGEARYAWSHAIPSRLTDKVEGHLFERSRRISLTFREALLPNDQAEYVGASPVEIDHVFRVYDNIAVHWNHTRGRRKVHWSRVKTFLEGLPAGSMLADIGSGDGKYFGLNPGVVCVGCDRSWNLLKVSQEPTHETLCCDIVRLPYRDSLFDATICVAVLHHLASKDRRVAAIRELMRITRPGGRVLIQAWAKEQEENSRLNFNEQDVLVPWRLQPRFFEDKKRDANKDQEKEKEKEKSSAEPLLPSALQSPEGACEHVQEDERGALVYQRYCHVYRKGELEDLCSSVPGAVVKETGWDRGNWFVLLGKEECSSVVLDLPVNPRQYAHPSFVSRKDTETGRQDSVESGSVRANHNPNAGMGQGNDLSMSKLRPVEVNNRAKKDVGVKRGN